MRSLVVLLHKVHAFFHRDTNSLLSDGLLVLLLTGYAALAYVAVIVLGALLLGDMPDPTFSPSWWLNLTACALIALVFLPVKRWLRDHINDVVYAQHDNPYVLLAKVNHQLQLMTTPQSTLPFLAETIAGVFQVPYVAIETASSNAPVRYAYGKPPAEDTTTRLPIAYLDTPMGALLVSARAANQPLSASDVALLRDVAQQVGIALHVVHLTADLQAARERLVIAREEERRRIRNDLHDGLAPTLASLQLQLATLGKLIRQKPDQAEAIANDLCEELVHATAEIRHLVYALRPPMLDELGLVEAIKHFRLPGSVVNFEVTAPECMPPLPAAVEVAVYRIASEAMHNVIKHAQAQICKVHIEVCQGQLTLTVTDNGTSVPERYQIGVGFRSMQERAAELGGVLSIRPGDHGGTQVVARLPLAS